MNSISKATRPVYESTSTNGYAELFSLVAPPTGSKTVVLSFTGPNGLTSYGCAGSISFTGVDQVTPNGASFTANGNSSAPSVTVTDSASGDMVRDHLNGYGPNAYTAGQTQRYSGAGFLTTFYNGAGQTANGAAGSVVMSWSNTGSQTWVLAACNIKAAGGPPPATNSGRFLAMF